MTVEGELDDISGSGQTRAAQDICSRRTRQASASTWKCPALAITASSVAAAGAHGVPASWLSSSRAMVAPVKAKASPTKAQTAAKPVAVPQTVVTKTVAKPAVKTAAKAAVKAPAKAAVKAAAKPVAKATAPAVKTTWVAPKKKA
jgi:poly(3-hydroxybutyrate) depolymerase